MTFFDKSYFLDQIWLNLISINLLNIIINATFTMYHTTILACTENFISLTIKRLILENIMTMDININ